MNRAVFLEAAARTARAIQADAVTAGDRCNWIGGRPRETPGGDVAIDHRALDATVYEGTSGIAVFLAATSVASGEQGLAQTATAAVRQALDRLDDEPPSLSFYTGTLGVIWAAGRVARLLDAPELADRARTHLRCLPTAPLQGFDLLSGAAGAVLGLLALRDLGCWPDDGSWLELACRCADVLVRDAVRTAAGASWSDPGLPSSANLTGLSHGTSGPMAALLALHRETGKPAYLDTATEALAYERSLFDPVVRNWPDLRSARHGNGVGPAFAPFWCHGAPGIAAARLTSYSQLDPVARGETDVAVASTEDMVRHMVSTDDNYSICHGLAGNADVLLIARGVLPQGISELPEEVGLRGLAAYQERGLPWPSGAYRAVNPSLFLGAAGTGYFLLRLHDPAIPTPLLPHSPADRRGGGGPPSSRTARSPTTAR